MRKRRNIRYSKPKFNSTFNNLHGDHTPQVIHRHNNPSTTFTNCNQRKFYTKSFKRNIYQDAAIDEPPRKRSKPNSSFNIDEFNATNNNCIKFESHLHKTDINTNNNKSKIDFVNNDNNYENENKNNKCTNEITITINKFGKIINPSESNNSNINKDCKKPKNQNIKKPNDISNNIVSNTNTITLPPTQLSLPHYSQNLSDTQIELEADKIIRHVFLDKSSSPLPKTNNKKSKKSISFYTNRKPQINPNPFLPY